MVWTWWSNKSEKRAPGECETRIVEVGKAQVNQIIRFKSQIKSWLQNIRISELQYKY